MVLSRQKCISKIEISISTFSVLVNIPFIVRGIMDQMYSENQTRNWQKIYFKKACYPWETEL